MQSVLRKMTLAGIAVAAIAAATAMTPGVAEARWGGHGGGHWGGGHWGGGHWHGGWGWGGYGWGFGSGLALGLAAPYYGGYYGGYPYAAGYAPYEYGDCYVVRRWVINRYGHRVLRRMTVCE